jgi:glycosyltransferase involved in cell wall biosynthesis
MIRNHCYSDNLHNKKILIIGPYPPPNGGVEIHIKRVKSKLEKQKNTVVIFDTSKKESSKIKVIRDLLRIFFTHKPQLVHLHEPTMSRLKLAITVLLRFVLEFKITSIDHNCRVLYNYSEFNKKIFRILTKKIDHVVVIGDTTNKCYIDNKVTTKKNYSIESPYLPPNIKEEHNIYKKYPQSLHNFIKTRTPLLTANAFALTLINNKDLYGFDMCIDLIKDLKAMHPNIGLIFGIAKNKEKKYLEKLKTIIKDLSLEKNIFIFISNEEFWPLIKRSDIFLRPTLSDGHSVSVKEACELHIPTIASNVCIRPEKTILFQAANKNDFYQKANTWIQSNANK